MNNMSEYKTQRISYASSTIDEQELNDISYELRISRSKLLRNIVDNFKHDYYMNKIGNASAIDVKPQ